MNRHQHSLRTVIDALEKSRQVPSSIISMARGALDGLQAREDRLSGLLKVLTNALVYDAGHERVAAIVDAARKELETGEDV